MTQSKIIVIVGSIKDLCDLGKRKFEEGLFQASLQHFEHVLTKDESNQTALLYKAIILGTMNKSEEALAILENLQNKKFDDKVVLKLVIKFLSDEGIHCFQNQKPEDACKIFELLLEYSPNNSLAKEFLLNEKFRIYHGDMIKPFIFNQGYIQQRDKLLSKHLKQKNLLEQIEWIIELIEFVNEHFNINKKPFSFTNQQLFTQSRDGLLLRFCTIGRELNKRHSSILSYLANIPNNVENEILDAMCLEALELGSVDLYFSELTVIFRLIFETIHQLPRNERIKQSKLLPWGENTWFYFEFLGALFVKNFDEQANVGVSLIAKLDQWQNDKDQLRHFYNSMLDFMCLVNIVSCSVIDIDLKEIKAFFLSYADHLKDPVNSKITEMKELPNLKIAVEYFKQSFSLYRLCTLLPHTNKEVTMLRVNESRIQDPLVQTPYALFQMDQTSFGKGLKGTFGFLHQISSIGELLTNRNFGSDLDSMVFIDSSVLQNIRNTLGHLEELQSEALILELEENEDALKKIYMELVILREKILDFIIVRQQDYHPWPESTKDGFSTWRNDLEAYWEQVKKVYNARIGSNETEAYAPHVPLLTVTEIETVLGFFRSDDEESKKFKERLSKELIGELKVSFKKNPTREMEPFLNTLDRAQKRTLKASLQNAYKHYDELRKVSTQDRENNKKKLLIEKNKKRQDNMMDFPTLSSFSQRFSLELENKEKMSATQVVKNLKNRFSKFIELLKESDIHFNFNEPFYKQQKMFKLFKNTMQNDISFFMGCSYLVVQIVSLLNQLSTAKTVLNADLEQIAELQQLSDFIKSYTPRLTDWVALRNLFMHPDGILESEALSYLHIHFNKQPITLNYFIIELLFNYNGKLEALPLVHLEDIVLNKANQIRQEKPINWEQFHVVFDQIATKGNLNNRFHQKQDESSKPVEHLTTQIAFR